jgi:hypothetical protein
MTGPAPSGSIPIHTPVVVTDGGPWATHDYACMVCRREKAVIDLGTGIFGPCWQCQSEGWRIAKRRRWRR